MSAAAQQAISSANQLIGQIHGHEKEEPVQKLDEIAKAIAILDQFETKGLDDTEVQKIEECKQNLQNLSKKVRENVHFNHNLVQREKEPTWLARNDGTGLTYLGMGFSLINLALRYLRDMPILLGFNRVFSKPVELPHSTTEGLKKTVHLHEKVSSFLKSTAPQEFSRYLIHKGVELNYCLDFDVGYLSSTESARESIRKAIETSDEQFVAFPIVLSHGRFSLIDHIVLILVDRIGNTIEYYDPKGVTSEHSFLKGGACVSDLLDECKLIQGNQYLIMENASSHQMCSNDCGVFLEKYLYERTVRKQQCDTIFQSKISDQEIMDFRKQSITFFQELANLDHVDPEFVINIPSSENEILSFDDNDELFS